MKDVTERGWESPQDLLNELERMYHDGTKAAEKIRRSDPERYRQQSDYWEGFIKAARRSLL